MVDGMKTLFQILVAIIVVVVYSASRGAQATPTAAQEQEAVRIATCEAYHSQAVSAADALRHGEITTAQAKAKALMIRDGLTRNACTP